MCRARLVLQLAKFELTRERQIEQEGDAPRPKRRCAQRLSRNLPSAAHYVGYVEEDETPAMIMKKFEELERVMKAAAAVSASRSAGVPSAERAAEAPSGTDRMAAQPSCGEGSGVGTPSVIDQQGDGALRPLAGTGGSEPSALDESMLLEVFKRTRSEA